MTVKENKPVSAKTTGTTRIRLKANRTTVFKIQPAFNGSFGASVTKTCLRPLFFTITAFRRAVELIKTHQYIRSKESASAHFFFTTISLLFCASMSTLFAQEQTQKIPPLRTILIENFETEDSKWKLQYRETITGTVYGVSEIDALLNVPGKSSGRYLLITYRGPGAHPVRILPPRPIFLSGNCLSLELMVYGRNRKDLLFALIEDIDGKRFRLSPVSLDFSGWQKVEITLPATYKRRPAITGQRAGLTFVGLEIKSYKKDLDTLEYEIDQIQYRTRDYFIMPENLL